LNTRATIYVDHLDDSSHYDWVVAWLAKWEGKVTIANYSTGGWEHCWDIEGSDAAVAEVPSEYLCLSRWSAPEILGA
jgi:hypothetical protein